ncbi:DUF2799 domain-containing protein [uncultured Ruegeria sp.]|uniref:DUF2799 domain-containing protein n=1 Tax=uncultured Ruegeria sp. TaxID=259304 RepID=UPI002637A202|nr:DUF2799 domain-containing protein [uncultured Ruegeria sp.]
MTEQAITGKEPKRLKKQLAKPLACSAIVAFGVCFGGAVHASDESSGLFSKMFPPENCIGKIDWSKVGLADGRLGIEPSYFSFYEKRCALRSRIPDKEAYFEAYHRGIRSYCTPENIYKLALGGAVAIDSCEKTSVILKAVQDGFAEHLKQ